MFKVFGICRLDPIQFTRYMRKACVYNDINFKIVNSTSKNLPKNSIVIFVGIAAFKEQIQSIIREKRIITPVVIDSFVNLEPRGFDIVDNRRGLTKDAAAIKYIIDNMNTQPNKSTYNIKSDQPIYDFIEKTKQTRRLTPEWQSIIYTIPNKQVKEVIRQAVSGYLTSAHDMAQMENLLRDGGPTRGEAKNKIHRIIELFKTDTAKALKDAITKVMKGEPVKSAAKQFNVGSFDVSFFLKMATSKEKEDILASHYSKTGDFQREQARLATLPAHSKGRRGRPRKNPNAQN